MHLSSGFAKFFRIRGQIGHQIILVHPELILKVHHIDTAQIYLRLVAFAEIGPIPFWALRIGDGIAVLCLVFPVEDQRNVK